MYVYIYIYMVYIHTEILATYSIDTLHFLNLINL